MAHAGSCKRSAVIGGGKISEQHLVALRRIAGVQVAAVCDLSPALAEFTAERFGVPNWFTDYRAMLDAEDVDVVHVLTPPATHQRIVADSLESGCHVIVEKPVALSNADFHALWALSQSRHKMLVENHNYRFNAPVRKLESLVADGTLGKVEEIEVRMALDIRSGGRYADRNLPHPSHQLPAGVIHEFISHLVYLFLHFVPEDQRDSVESVRAAWRNEGGGELFKYDSLDAVLIAGAVHGRLRFSSRQWPDALAVTVRGSRGVASAELFHPVLQLTKQRGGSKHLTPLVNALGQSATLFRSGFGSIWSKIRNRTAYEGLDLFLRQTYEALASGSKPPVGFDDMDRTSRVIDALLARENRL
ncbi:MAG: Gfo/Idh/MocA family oxidoreductase [Gammaproteobacteria bacterium]|nr:Gfo/Idh/MocA family oxidoreductase [Gammaproteobacteria bacterium]